MISMGLERVIEEILSSGEAQRRKILSEAEKERRKIISAAKVEADTMRKEMNAETEQQILLRKQQALSSGELEAKKRVLQEQNTLLLRVREEVLEELSSKDSAERRALLEKLGRIAKKRLGKGIVHCRIEDGGLFLAPSGFKKVNDLKASGGLIAESEDGAYRIDLTFEALLDEVWGKSVKNIFDTLFGGA